MKVWLSKLEDLEISDDNKRRFWDLVDKTPGQGPAGECWTWSSSVGRRGEGRFFCNKTSYTAHRLSARWSGKKLKKYVLQTCKNKLCVNPDHLVTSEHISGKTSKVRFWEKVDKTPGLGPNGSCWVWTGGLVRHGYGGFSVEGKIQRAHRLAAEWSGWELEDYFVCHTCDNPPCVNPDHLFLGTALQNTQDMLRKGRKEFLKGEKHPGAKLTNNKVLDIRKLHSEGGSRYIDLAVKFKVSIATIERIVNNHLWKEVK
jgi:hypothetical protein